LTPSREYELNMPRSGALIAARKNQVFIVLVDDDIAEELRGKKLNVNRKGYVVTSQKYRGRYMLQTSIMQPEDGMVVDHINGDKLDNRRSNLQIVTNAENCRKRPNHHTNKTGYRGVYPHKNGTFSAAIMVNYKRKSLGMHATAEDAARAYDDAVRKYHGNFGCLNFPLIGEVKANAS